MTAAVQEEAWGQQQERVRLGRPGRAAAMASGMGPWWMEAAALPQEVTVFAAETYPSTQVGCGMAMHTAYRRRHAQGL